MSGGANIALFDRKRVIVSPDGQKNGQLLCSPRNSSSANLAPENVGESRGGTCHTGQVRCGEGNTADQK